jgi:hypothetical protein
MSALGFAPVEAWAAVAWLWLPNTGPIQHQKSSVLMGASRCRFPISPPATLMRRNGSQYRDGEGRVAR